MNIEITADNADFLKQAIYRLVDTERAKLSKNYYSRSVLVPVAITPSLEKCLTISTSKCLIRQFLNKQP